MPAIGRLLKSCRDVLLTPAEDPRLRWESAIQRQRSLIAQVRRSIARVSETTARVQERLVALRARHSTLEEEARLAVAVGNDDLARAILRHQQLTLAEQSLLEGHLRDLRQQAQQLTNAEHQLTARIDAWIVRRELIAARLSAAEVRAGIDLAEDLPDIDAALDQLDARAAALDELSGAGILASIQPDIHDAAIEIQLGALKSAMAVNE